MISLFNFIINKGEKTNLEELDFFDTQDTKYKSYYTYLKSNIIKSESWYHLALDKKNNILWQLDIADKYQRILAIKLSSEAQFPLDTESRNLFGMKYLEKFYQIGKENCHWQDCKKMALKKLAFCTEHAFHQMNIR